ncbi:T9SS type A sorting domain-containing protein [Flavobacterium sp. HNIBRBA15423]|uniref:T9SS type A sorting domain-containing protein n=1 Tax=Flavobacterium sp. HNIBRBA15423 TaxID=3458683 RepID=UPI004044D375
MKKIYFLLFSLFSLVTYSQGSEDFTNSTATATYADGNFTGNDGFTWSYGHSRNEETYGIDGNGLMLRRASDSYLQATIPGGVGNLSFQYRKAFTGNTERQLEILVNGVAVTTTPAFGTVSETTVYDFNFDINQPGSVVITIKNVGVTTTNRQTVIDNIVWTSFSGTPTPSLSISSPANATMYAPNTTNVNVSMNVLNFNVANGTGDGHLTYSINGATAIDKFDTTDITIPVTQGQSYTVELELVDNTGAPLSTPVTATVSFSIASFIPVTDIATLRADVITNGAGRYYEVTGNPIITYARATRNQKYIQDATAGILIDDNTAIITTTMVEGDAIAGLRGQTSIFNGVLQLLPIEDATVFSSSNTITPQIVTIADILGDIEAYESELVQINGVTFADGNGATTFAVNTNYDINDGATMTFRSMFAEANYVVNTDLVPTGANNIVVLVAEFNGTAQVVARDLSDLTLSTKSFNAIDGLTMYPNPLSGNTLNFSSTANNTMTVQIFDILGKEVAKGNVVNNTFNTGNLNAGIYIVKVTEEGKTATRKLVVK